MSASALALAPSELRPLFLPPDNPPQDKCPFRESVRNLGRRRRGPQGPFLSFSHPGFPSIAAPATTRPILSVVPSSYRPRLLIRRIRELLAALGASSTAASPSST